MKSSIAWSSLAGAIIEADLTWTGTKFESGVRIACDDAGRIAAIGRNLAPSNRDVVRLHGEALLPGMVNVHSHAFQRALRSRSTAPASNAASTNFWCWREQMYSLVNAIDRQTMYDRCFGTFVEMLNAGITCVGEFHYLHHSVERGAAGGSPYDLDRVVLDAARDANIRIVLLQTYYEQAGLSAPPLEPAQRHFLTTDPADFWRSVDDLSSSLDRRTQTIGVAAHSVRAVPAATIAALYAETAKRGLPFHVHLEEQPKEIADCVGATGKTPSELLLGIVPAPCPLVTIVHATHSAPTALNEWIRREANICICPLTEGNLGDGIFVWPSSDAASSLHCSIGTDSNRRICFVEEMRWLAYLQQMRTLQPFANAHRVFSFATVDGARALSLADVGSLQVGNHLDFFTLRLGHPTFEDWQPSTLLDHFIFGTSSEGAIASVGVGGRWRHVRCGEEGGRSLPPPTTIDVPAPAIDGSSVLTLTASLMAIDSTSGREGALSGALRAWLEREGWFVESQRVGSANRFNLLATVGRRSEGGDGPRLILNSHLDTVPPFIAPTVDGAVLRGRGSCDAKGQIAAMIVATKRLPAELAREVGLLFVVGEEVDHVGMVEANKLGLRPDFIIVGEPTELTLARRQKGILKLRLNSVGRAAHSGYPAKGESAFLPLLAVLGDLAATRWPSDPQLGDTTLNIGVVEAGAAANVIPAMASATLMFRVVMDVASLMRDVERIVAGRVQLEVITQNDPVELATLGKGRFEESVVAFNTDIPYFKTGKPGMRAFLLGASSITDAHAPNEFVRVEDLETVVDMYVEIITQLLQG